MNSERELLASDRKSFEDKFDSAVQQTQLRIDSVFEKFEIGASYRLDDSFSGLVNFAITPVCKPTPSKVIGDFIVFCFVDIL